VAVARGRDTGASTHGCDDNTTGGVSMPTDSLRPALRWGDTALQARAAGEARLQSLLGAMASTHSEAEWSCVWELWELWVLWEAWWRCVRELWEAWEAWWRCVWELWVLWEA
jgi:hypothetical protein